MLLLLFFVVVVVVVVAEEDKEFCSLQYLGFIAPLPANLYSTAHKGLKSGGKASQFSVLMNTSDKFIAEVLQKYEESSYDPKIVMDWIKRSREDTPVAIEEPARKFVTVYPFFHV